MPIRTDWDIEVTVDDALRGQGANAEIIRKRSPKIVDTTERALSTALPLLQPVVIYKELEVTGLRHDKLLLSDGGSLSGKLIATHLGAAQRVTLVVCTVSEAISWLASKEMQENMLYGLALDGIGSAAVEVLANDVCAWLETKSDALGWKTSIPLSPGVEGWPLDEGQPQIFKSLVGESNAVLLTESFLMEPVKSLSFVVGMGKDLQPHGTTCDLCGLQHTCQYKKHDAPNV